MIRQAQDDSNRPAKRQKLSQPFQRPSGSSHSAHQSLTCGGPQLVQHLGHHVGHSPAPFGTSDEAWVQSLHHDEIQVNWPGPHEATHVPHGDIFYHHSLIQPITSHGNGHLAVASPFEAPTHVLGGIDMLSQPSLSVLSTEASPSGSHMSFIPANGFSMSVPGSSFGSDNGNAMYFQSNVHNHSLVQADKMQTAPSASEAPLAVTGIVPHHQVVGGTLPPRKLENPFRKCRGTFGSFKLNPRFRLTKSRQHGYIKYENPRLPAGSSSQEVAAPIVRHKSWGVDNSRRRAISTIHEANSSDSDGSEVEELDHPEAYTRSYDTLRQLEQDHRDAAALASSRDRMTPAEAADGENLRKSVQRSLGLIQVSTNPMTRRMLERGSPDELVFFAFYCRNWLPGRSIHGADNVWQEDFLLLGQNRYVYHAFMSIPAVHILDMMPSRRSLGLANYLLEEANKGIDASFEQYNSGQLLSSAQLDCTLTTLIALVIQDTNLPERRRKMRDHCPWLDALYCCEQLLERHNPHAGYYNPENVQMSSLRAAQCKLVARGIITAETMLPYEPALQYSTYDGSKASSRFRWLRYGNVKDRHQIQGGVGMCRRLLELLRQITLWSGAMSQSDASGGNMLQVENIMNCLEDMRQWAPNCLTWDEAKEGPPTKVWVDSHFAGGREVIQTSAEMTSVSAEAYRLGAKVYAQCRLLRLPRDHPDVLMTLTDLANCVHILPTHGKFFSAQAPLFPVFYLGLLSTEDRHREVAAEWFAGVISFSTRSTVPPLYNAIRRIRRWIDNVEPALPLNTRSLPASISDRDPWWERLVAEIKEREPMTLCLT